jgi:YD repeat-containing protein
VAARRTWSAVTTKDCWAAAAIRASTNLFSWIREATYTITIPTVWGVSTNCLTPPGMWARTYSYDSFGKISAQTGTLDQPFTFTGREYDPETGFYYYRARYYDPKAGRFISKVLLFRIHIN